MDMIKFVDISLQVWGAVLLLIILICVRLGGCKNDVRRYFMRMLAFTEYLTSYLSARTAVSRKPVCFMRILCAATVVAVVVSQFNHMFYRIDENNLYCRGPYFWLSQACGIGSMMAEVWLLIRYRASLSRKESVVIWSYVVLPVAAMSIQIKVYGIACLNIATTVSLLFLYIGIQMEHVVKRLQATEFSLPALTRQPLVENAIRHGMADGGEGRLTVTVSSWEEADGWYLQVTDNGNGFEQEKNNLDGKSHVGIENTRSRVEAMCGGTLQVFSTPGRGTQVIVRIPKGEGQYEGNCS